MTLFECLCKYLPSLQYGSLQWPKLRKLLIPMQMSLPMKKRTMDKLPKAGSQWPSDSLEVVGNQNIDSIPSKKSTFIRDWPRWQSYFLFNTQSHLPIHKYNHPTIYTHIQIHNSKVHPTLLDLHWGWTR